MLNQWQGPGADPFEGQDVNALLQMLAQFQNQSGGPEASAMPSAMGQSAQNALLPPQVPVGQGMPQNFLRNNSTGKVYSMDLAAGPAPTGPQPDYAQPIDISGYGKGYRSKDDPYKVLLADGRTVDIGVDRAATNARRKESVEAERKLLENELLRANIGKATRPGSGQRLPMGQRMTPEGNLEWIPGSAGDIKAKSLAQKAEEQYNVHAAGTDALIRNIDQLIGNDEMPEHPGLRGSVGYLDAKLPPVNRNQATAQALIKGLLSKSAVSGLQQIRQSGTAPGSITEKEWPLFQNLIATLDPTQDEKTFTEQLKELRRVASESKARAAHGFQSTYGKEPSSAAAPSVAAPATAPATYVEVRVAPNGQKIGKKADGTYEVIK